MVRSFFLVALSLLAAATHVTAKATQRDDTCVAEICGLTPTPTTANIAERVDTAAHMSNAERLARGLPPKKPSRRFQGGTPVVKARDSAIPPKNYRAMIQVLQASDNTLLGYISNDFYSGAQSRYQPDISNAAIFDFTLPGGSTTGDDIELTPENLDSAPANTFPFFGLVQGRDSSSTDMNPGSFNYGYFATTAHTDAGSTPQSPGNSYTSVTHTQRASESSVWSVDVVAGTITPQWINSDGGAAAITLFIQSTALYFGGDSNAFAARYPAPVTVMTLKLVLL